MRYHGEVARLEVGRDEMARLLDPQIGETLSREFRKLGFRFVTLDLGGFRSGSLNEGVVATSRIDAPGEVRRRADPCTRTWRDAASGRADVRAMSAHSRLDSN